MTSRTLRILGMLFAATLLVAACGDDDDETATTETADDTSGDDTSGDDSAGEDGGGAADDDETDDDDETGDETNDDDGTASDADAPVQEGETSLGPVLVDAEGRTLYAFTPDDGGTPTCTDACADIWPPLFTDASELPEGLDPSVFSVVEHPSGKPQLAAGGWPLYYFAQDAAPGDVKGQGVGGNWFVVAPDGSLVEAPAGTGAAQTGSSSPGELGY